MSKLSTKHRTGQRGNGAPIVSQHATYQGNGEPMSTTPNYGNGAPMNYTVPQSWGAGCPTGCTAAGLAQALGREFAGERYPCRELTYWLALTSDAGGLVDVSQNSKVTICPTRVVVFAPVTLGNGLLTVFEVGNQNQIVGDPIPVAFLHPASYGIIPFVTDCLRAGTPFRVAFSGLPATTFFAFGIVGPTIG